MSAEPGVLASGQWVPYRVTWENDSPVFGWHFIGSKTLSEPFFEETLMACRSLPENGKRVTSNGAELLKAAGNDSPVEPAVIIFHVSRCGSTLLSQLLITDEPNTVLSEVPLLDELLSCIRSGKVEAEQYYKAIVTILGKRSTEATKRVIIKSDSWHLGHYHILRKMFPRSLFVFLSREPGAVVRSHNRQAGIQSVMGTPVSTLLFSPEQLEKMNPTEYLSSVLSEYYRIISALASADKNSLVFDYSNGILKLVELIYAKCRIPFTDVIRMRMEDRMKFHSKRVQDVFSEGTTAAAHLRLTPEAIAGYQQLLTATETT